MSERNKLVRALAKVEPETRAPILEAFSEADKEIATLKAAKEAAEARAKGYITGCRVVEKERDKVQAELDDVERERDTLKAERKAIREECKDAGIKPCDYDTDVFPDAGSRVWIPDHNEGTATIAIAPRLAALLQESNDTQATLDGAMREFQEGEGRAE